jgi:hypothetical protein
MFFIFKLRVCSGSSRRGSEKKSVQNNILEVLIGNLRN